MSDARATPRLAPVTAAPVQDLGELLSAQQIAERMFSGQVGKRWVIENLPLDIRVTVGRRICAYELHARAWAAGRVGGGR